MDIKRHEDTMLPLSSIVIAGVTVFVLQDFYVGYTIYFGWIMLYVVHLVIAWIMVVLISEKVKRFLKIK